MGSLLLGQPTNAEEGGLGFFSPGRGPVACLAYPELVTVMCEVGTLAGPPSGTLGLSASSHVAARAAVLEAWDRKHPGLPMPLGAAQFYQALGALEGQYGLGWQDKPSPVTGLQTSMEGSNNWGAIQCQNCPAQDGVCCDGCGYWFDSRPTASGQQYFEQCFKRYPDPAAGAKAVMDFLDHYQGVIAALPSNDLDEIAWQMRLGGYYQGFSTDKKVAAATYAKGLNRYVHEMAEALGEDRVMRRRGGQTTSIDCGSECEGPAPGEAGGEADGAAGWGFWDVALAAAGTAALGYGAFKVAEWALGELAPGHRLANPSPATHSCLRASTPSGRSRVEALGDQITVFLKGKPALTLPRGLWIVKDQEGDVWGKCSVALCPQGAARPGEMRVLVTGHVSGDPVPRTPREVAVARSRGALVGEVPRIWYTRYDRPRGMDHTFKGPAHLYRAGRGYRLELPKGCVVNSTGFVQP